MNKSFSPIGSGKKFEILQEELEDTLESRLALGSNRNIPENSIMINKNAAVQNRIITRKGTNQLAGAGGSGL